MTIEEIKMLQSAENEMNNSEVLIRDFLDKNYRKPYILEKRVKKIEKLRIKQELFLKQYGCFVKLEDLPDIIGFRIAVESEADVEELSRLVNNLLAPNRIIDYYNNPRPTGFKAFLYYFQNNGINTEIQIMTEQMLEWTNATHKEHDDRKYGSIK